MRYLTTLEVARELNVSKQTLLNWLYAKKVPEPPRTVIHREPVDDPVVVREVAREVSQFLKDAQIPLRRFVRELNQVYSRGNRQPAKKRRG